MTAATSLWKIGLSEDLGAPEAVRHAARVLDELRRAGERREGRRQDRGRTNEQRATKFQ